MKGAAVPSAAATETPTAVSATATATVVTTATATTAVDPEDGHRDFVYSTVAELESDPRPRRGCLWWFACAVGVLFLLTALAQIILAGVIREKGIEIIDWWISESFYPRAGSPWVGVMSFVVALCFMFLVGCERHICGGFKCCFESCVPIIIFVSVFLSQTDRAVYNRLSEYDECVEITDEYTFDWSYGDCACLKDGGEAYDQRVSVKISSSMSCGRILGYLDPILASYVLMNVLMILMAVVTILVIILHCAGMTSFAAAPRFAMSTAVAVPSAAPTSTTVTATAT